MHPALPIAAQTTFLVKFDLTSAHAERLAADIPVIGRHEFDTAHPFGATTEECRWIYGVRDAAVSFVSNMLRRTEPRERRPDRHHSDTDNHEAIFGAGCGHLVNADDPDASPHSALMVNIGVSEVFFSDLLSDTFFGDERHVGGIDDGPLGAFGDGLSDSGSELFELPLTPGDLIALALRWTFVDSDLAGHASEGELSATLNLVLVTNVSSPSTVDESDVAGALLAEGLLLTPLAHRRQPISNRVTDVS